jgi:hypothetical protein
MKIDPWAGSLRAPINAWTSLGGRSSPSYQVTLTVLPSLNRVPGKTYWMIVLTAQLSRLGAGPSERTVSGALSSSAANTGS